MGRRNRIYIMYNYSNDSNFFRNLSLYLSEINTKMVEKKRVFHRKTVGKTYKTM